ncbi:MAG: YegP family protein [Firmicutes bacterium]|nr:YegP family protein [Bacillota bacterium]
MGKFTLRRVPSGVRFDLRASNGEVIASSEVYRTLAACRAGAQSVRRCAAAANVEDLTAGDGGQIANPKFQLFQDRAGQFRFRLKARNGQVIAASEGYRTKAGALSGMESVRANAPGAALDWAD